MDRPFEVFGVQKLLESSLKTTGCTRTVLEIFWKWWNIGEPWSPRVAATGGAWVRASLLMKGQMDLEQRFLLFLQILAVKFIIAKT